MSKFDDSDDSKTERNELAEERENLRRKIHKLAERLRESESSGRGRQKSGSKENNQGRESRRSED